MPGRHALLQQVIRSAGQICSGLPGPFKQIESLGVPPVAEGVFGLLYQGIRGLLKSERVQDPQTGYQDQDESEIDYFMPSYHGQLFLGFRTFYGHALTSQGVAHEVAPCAMVYLNGLQ